MRHPTKLRLRRDTVRVLTPADLRTVAGGHPTGFPTVCTSYAVLGAKP